MAVLHRQKKPTNTTLCFLLKEDHILLAMKKRGFGVGKWNGTGGKCDGDETIEETAVRETEEEIGVRPITIEQVATLYFYFSHNVEKLGEAEETAVYLCWEWEGEPHETEEMKPQWFRRDALPFEEMWDDDKYWVPLVLDGKKIEGKFWFDKDFRLKSHEVTIVGS